MHSRILKLLSPVILYMLLFLIPPNKVLAQSWLSPDWNYRMKILVKNTGNSYSLTDYQVKVQLNSSNFNFSLAQSKGEDVRFTRDDGTTLIDHWIEYWNNVAESALVWLKVPDVPALDSTAVYVYYGNLGATNSSNGKGTFEFFDDFESDYLAESGWSVKAPLPSFKADNASVVYNNLLFIFGGYDRNPATCVKYYLAETFVYDPITNTWTQLANMPTPRWGPVAVELNGLIHIFAGEAITGLTGAHEVYNPATNTWSTWSNVPPQLADQGGMGISYGNKIHLFLRQYHYEYDPATDTYTAKANVPTPRTWGTCALVNGLIYVIGGYSYGSPSGATNVNEVYNPATNTWTTRAPMPVKKYGATRENPVIGGKIYVTHGRDGSFFTNNYVYDPSTNTWSKKSSGVNPRDGVGCGVINDRLYVVGGRDIFSCAVGRNYVEEYDPANDKGEVWVLSNTSVIKRDTLAKYERAYGFLFDKSSSGDGVSAQHYHNFTSCAVDVYWNITDYWGVAYSQPEGAILLTDNAGDGSLSYFNNNGRPEFSWYRGSYRFLQTGTWNRWYPVTIIWNGSNSKVIIDGREYMVSAAATNSNRVYLRVNKITREYFDLVRVRKYSFPEPAVALGPAESSNHPPILILQDTTFFLCEPETVSFNLLAIDPDSPDTITLEKFVGPGDFNPLTGPSPLNTTHSFLPALNDSTYLFIFKVTDTKGAFVQDSFFVHIYINQSPILTLPEDIDTVLCNLGDSLYLTVRGEDPDITDTLTLEKISSPGELLPTNPVSGTSPRLANFLWKPEYSDTLNNPHEIIFKLKDLCGKEVQDTLLIYIRFNHPPLLTLPLDTIYNMCNVDTICFNHILAADPDPEDSVFVQKLSGPGVYDPSTGICCFLPSISDSIYTFIFQGRDLCGTSTLDTFNLTVNLNRTPALVLPIDTSYKLCVPGDSIFFEVSGSVPGDSLSLTKLSIEGELRPTDPVLDQDSVKGIFVWKPDYPDTFSNPHLLIFEVRDNCGLSHTDTVQIRIEFNHLPVLVSQNSSYSLCNDSIICFNNLIGSDSDPDDSVGLELVSGPNCLFLTTVLSPTLITGFTCFQTTGTDTVYPFIFELKDRCGAKAVDTVYITVSPPANLLRGDPNGDAFVTVSDVIYIINYLFKSGPPPTNCPKSGDVNCDFKITVSDVVYLISYLFKGGPPPCD